MANTLGEAIFESLYGGVLEALAKAEAAEPNTMYPDLRRYGAEEEGLAHWLTHKIRKHAKSGNTSKLATYVGMARASWPHMPKIMGEVLKLAVNLLRAEGRVVKLGEPGPRKWISRADGTPRW